MTDLLPSGLVAALAAASAEFGSLVPDGLNPHFASRYVTLGALIAATRPALARHGLVLAQVMDVTESGVHLVTRLHHVSGESLESRFPVPPWRGPQDAGSLLTYLRRYALSALLNVAADIDDDANAASDKLTAKRPTYEGKFPGGSKPRSKAAPPQHIAAEQVDAHIARWSDEIDAAQSVAGLKGVGAAIALLPESVRLDRHLRARYSARHAELEAIEQDGRDLAALDHPTEETP